MPSVQDITVFKTESVQSRQLECNNTKKANVPILINMENTIMKHICLLPHCLMSPGVQPYNQILVS